MPYGEAGIGGGGGGGGGGGTAQISASQMPDLYNPLKYARFVWECFGTGNSLPSPLGSSSTSSTFAQAAESGRIGVLELTSSTTANGNAWNGAVLTSIPISSNPTITYYFKTPATIDPLTNIQVGLFVIAGGTDRTCLDINGTSGKFTNIINGVAVSSSSTYTFTPSTWYVVRMTISSSGFTGVLYSETGVSLLSHTMAAPLSNTGTVPTTATGLRASNSGTVAVPMVRIDFFEYVINLGSSTRTYIDN